METHNFTTHAFECGCHFEVADLCDEAAELWRKVQDTYASANLGLIPWDEYARAQQAYFQHFEGKVE